MWHIRREPESKTGNNQKPQTRRDPNLGFFQDYFMFRQRNTILFAAELQPNTSYHSPDSYSKRQTQNCTATSEKWPRWQCEFPNPASGMISKRKQLEGRETETETVIKTLCVYASHPGVRRLLWEPPQNSDVSLILLSIWNMWTSGADCGQTLALCATGRQHKRIS